ncbi:hypothetical protein CFP56_018086 [Quercus suber]|uniref:Uncharacterized protein n=1 Tax=Quercus suber TaxID=58331 RepID=A0AAW0KMW4_QUESU
MTMRREMGIRGRAIWRRREKYWPLFDRLKPRSLWTTKKGGACSVRRVRRRVGEVRISSGVGGKETE